MMQENNNLPDQLELLSEMNRLFLAYLQDRARRDLDCLGLPGSVTALLRSADQQQLERAAELPHALFQLNLDAGRAADAVPARSPAETNAVYCLQISLLHSARDLCRQNSHLAQSFLRLSAKTLIRLRCLALIDLAGIAEQTHLVVVRFIEQPWIWKELLCTQIRSETRQLRLIALQPRVTDLTDAPESVSARIR